MVVLLSLKKVKRNGRAKRTSVREIRRYPTLSLDQSSGPDSTIKLYGTFEEVAVGIMKRHRQMYQIMNSAK
jgi:hypothetical protein